MATLAERAIGWAVKLAARSVWRVAPAMDLDDLVQDAHMVWLRCEQRYGTGLAAPHRMALFKTAYQRHLDRLARKRVSGKSLVYLDGGSVAPDDAHMLVVLDRGPEALRQAIGGDRADRVRQGTARFHVRYEYELVGIEHFRRLGHEMHTGLHDYIRVGF